MHTNLPHNTIPAALWIWLNLITPFNLNYVGYVSFNGLIKGTRFSVLPLLEEFQEKEKTSQSGTRKEKSRVQPQDMSIKFCSMLSSL